MRQHCVVVDVVKWITRRAISITSVNRTKNKKQNQTDCKCPSSAEYNLMVYVCVWTSAKCVFHSSTRATLLWFTMFIGAVCIDSLSISNHNVCVCTFEFDVIRFLDFFRLTIFTSCFFFLLLTQRRQVMDNFNCNHNPNTLNEILCACVRIPMYKLCKCVELSVLNDGKND